MLLCTRETVGNEKHIFKISKFANKWIINGRWKSPKRCIDSKETNIKIGILLYLSEEVRAVHCKSSKVDCSQSSRNRKDL